MNDTLKVIIEAPLKAKIKSQAESIEMLKLHIKIVNHALKDCVYNLETLTLMFSGETSAKDDVQKLINHCKQLL